MIPTKLNALITDSKNVHLFHDLHTQFGVKKNYPKDNIFSLSLNVIDW